MTNLNCLNKLILSTLLCIGYTAQAHASDLNLILKYDIAKASDNINQEQIGSAVLEYKVTEGVYLKAGGGYAKRDSAFGTLETYGVVAGIEVIIPIK